MYAAEFLPKLGYAKRTHLMHSMVPGLSGAKMSSSDPKSKIDFLDKPAEVKAKLKAALCPAGEVEGNGVLAFVKSVLIPVQQLREENAQARGEKEAPRGEGSFVKEGAPPGSIFTVARPEKFGGDIHFSSYDELEGAYRTEMIHPGDLKGAITDALNTLLAPVQKAFESDPEWQEAERLGYGETAASNNAKAAGEKKEAKPKAAKEIRRAPPTEEERAALRAQKEQEKAAKAAAKGDAGPSNVAIRNTHLPKLKLLSQGKVRDIYAMPDEKDADKLLFVATDRISAFDYLMVNVNLLWLSCLN
jgi:tyrosyl-tRNA synthetase